MRYMHSRSYFLNITAEFDKELTPEKTNVYTTALEADNVTHVLRLAAFSSTAQRDKEGLSVWPTAVRAMMR